MSRSHKNGHGRCGTCGDKGAIRRARERAWQDADNHEEDMSPGPRPKTVYDKDRGLDPWGRW